MNAADLYKSILLHAAEVYGVGYEDVERQLGQEFDPMVRFMAGALADELEGVYQQIDNTERRLLRRLSTVLLPEYQQTPSPAHALMRCHSDNINVLLEETTQFVFEDEETEQSIGFTPVFPSRILPVVPRVIVSEKRVFEQSRQSLRRRKGTTEDTHPVRRISVGFHASESIRNWNSATLYFDLTGGSESEPERALLFNALKRAQCALHRHVLGVRNGLPQAALSIEDYLNGNERLHNRINNQYKRQFLTFTDREIPPVEPMEAEQYLERWFKRYGNDPEDITTQISKLGDLREEPLYWLEIELSKPLEISSLETKLKVEFNVTPVVNRNLNGDGKSEHHYLQDYSIKWVALEPKEDFLSIRSVYEESGDQTPFVFKPFADFKGERMPSYTLRMGGVGRWDDFNAWHRLAYLVRILREDFKYSELVEQAAGALSLEDVHQLLKSRIAASETDLNPLQRIYVLLHAGVEKGMRVRVEYWTSIGDAANKIPAKARLRCTSRIKGQLTPDSIELVTMSQGGRDPLNNLEQLYAMKSALLSRDRIVTREDIKAFCQAELGEKLKAIAIATGVGVDERYDEGMTRIMEIQLEPHPDAVDDDWVGLCRHLQNELEQKSSSSIPLKVKMKS